ncbi:hypothetical protein DIPPA_01448 [Diplonema papillatum]|nr:hypothetical protein DIPPA_01448 [Diplonema papillatum]
MVPEDFTEPKAGDGGEEAAPKPALSARERRIAQRLNNANEKWGGLSLVPPPANPRRGLRPAAYGAQPLRAPLKATPVPLSKPALPKGAWKEALLNGTPCGKPPSVEALEVFLEGLPALSRNSEPTDPKKQPSSSATPTPLATPKTPTWQNGDISPPAAMPMTPPAAAAGVGTGNGASREPEGRRSSEASSVEAEAVCKDTVTMVYSAHWDDVKAGADLLHRAGCDAASSKTARVQALLMECIARYRLHQIALVQHLSETILELEDGRNRQAVAMHYLARLKQVQAAGTLHVTVKETAHEDPVQSPGLSPCSGPSNLDLSHRLSIRASEDSLNGSHRTMALKSPCKFLDTPLFRKMDSSVSSMGDAINGLAGLNTSSNEDAVSELGQYDNDFLDSTFRSSCAAPPSKSPLHVRTTDPGFDATSDEVRRNEGLRERAARRAQLKTRPSSSRLRPQPAPGPPAPHSAPQSSRSAREEPATGLRRVKNAAAALFSFSGGRRAGPQPEKQLWCRLYLNRLEVCPDGGFARDVTSFLFPVPETPPDVDLLFDFNERKFTVTVTLPRHKITLRAGNLQSFRMWKKAFSAVTSRLEATLAFQQKSQKLAAPTDDDAFFAHYYTPAHQQQLPAEETSWEPCALHTPLVTAALTLPAFGEPEA